MNAAQIHLALNHVPLFLSIIGGGVLIFGMIKKNEGFKTLSLYMLVAAALFTAPVFLTGEGTEELVEHLPGVTEDAIGKHESWAKISLVVIIVTGVMALVGLFFRKHTGIARVVLAGALILSLASFGTMAQTAHLGGLIRHAELQNSAVAGNESEKGKEEGEEADNAGKSTGQQDKAISDSLKKAEKTIRKRDDDD